jgi:hypothetical protein
MTDLRNFVRYLVPGLTLVIEFALVLIAASYNEAFCLFADLPKDIGTILGGTLFLAGVGYLIGLVHHRIIWSCLGCCYGAIDFSPVLKRLHKNNFIRYFPEEQEITTVEFSRAEAWRVFTALWYSRLNVSEIIKGANNRADSLSDLMHGLGSAFVACVLSIIFAYVVAKLKFEHISCLKIAIAISVLLVLHFSCYRISIKQTQGFVERVLFHDLVTSKVKSESPQQEKKDTPVFWISRQMESEAKRFFLCRLWPKCDKS